MRCGVRGSSGAKVSRLRRLGVDDLLARVASELDAARAAGPLVENAGGRGCDIDGVGLFLGQLFSHPGPGRSGQDGGVSCVRGSSRR